MRFIKMIIRNYTNSVLKGNSRMGMNIEKCLENLTEFRKECYYE